MTIYVGDCVAVSAAICPRTIMQLVLSMIKLSLCS